MKQPFLDTEFLPSWTALTAEHIVPDITTALEEAKKNIAAICDQKGDFTYENTVLALEEATENLNRAWGRVNHLDAVCDAPELRKALNDMLPAVSDFYSSLSLNDALWHVIKTYGESDDVKNLTPLQQRHVSETLLDFTTSGADLPATQKKRISEIDAELALLTKSYAENVLDSTNAWEKIITDEKMLDGLPESAKAAAAADALAKGVATAETPAWRFTLQFPSMFPVMQYAHDESFRKDVWQASVNVGAVSPHDNSELVWKIIELRTEKAKILGHENFADATLTRRMARDGKTAMKFTEDLHLLVKNDFHREYRELCEYKAKKTGTACDALQPWETAYWAEMQRQENFDLDDEVLRPYFSVNRVMSGMFDLASKLFGITISQIEVPADKLWHPEVKVYELKDEKSGEHLGSFYADWHPRESKRGGAWMNQLETGKPHLGLIIGNMTPPIDGKPALLTHNEVETIFHEFGHLLHGLLSDVSVKSLSGTNVPWDFVELPSQIMENFCWERESLDFFARHFETDEVIPEALYQKMIAAKNYMSATAFMRQLAFGKLDLELHTNPEKWRGDDLNAVEQKMLEEYRVPLLTATPGMSRRFNHLFSSPTGYAAGYYSYKWAEVLDADAFTRFQKEGILNGTTGRDFREQILSKGNSQPVEKLYENFMGREPSLEPLLVRSGLSNQSVA